MPPETGVNGAVWIALLGAERAFPLLPLGVTAYLLGLRHAVDPDHIAAIDGTMRKLLRDGQKPVAVGFYFSLGHSTIVFVLSVLVALTRVLRPALGLVKRSWHMYPVGVLFGLGFDTATEIALLGISAASGAGGMPVAYILILPSLFAAGMSLVDTTEGVAMLGAYGWAYLQPARKVLYNLNMTLLTITIALFVGGAEAFAAMGAHPLLSFPTLGYGIMAIFGGNVALSAFLYRFHR